MRTILAIYSKPPIPGRTKSRLAVDVGDVAAAELAAALLADLLVMAAALPGVETQLWRPPDCDAAGFGALVPASVSHRVQVGADLGERMSHTCRTALEAEGAEHVLIVGSDCGTHEPAAIAAAIAALRTAAVVFRPAADGGYVLVGQRVWTPAVFAGPDWGAGTVMRQTRVALAAAGLRAHELAPTFDVDTVADLRPLALTLRAAVGHDATRKWLTANGY